MAYTMNLGFSDLPTIYNVHFPVGPKMPNLRDDVMLVQMLMKLANFTRNNPGMGPVESSRSIKVDGWFGDQTKRMITAFEANRKSAGMLLIADGVIESSSKDGYTGKGVLYKIIHLNRSARRFTEWEYDGLPFSPDTHPILLESLKKGAIRPPWLK